MSSICIIPARGGSKRIPRKNIKPFLGKPIISYSIQTALDSGIFDEIMVSTDDAEIAEIATKYGAKVPYLRSAQNSDDSAPTVDVLHEVLCNYATEKMQFDNVCCLYPCAPLVSVDTLIKSKLYLEKNKYDCLYPIVKYSYPIQRALHYDNGSIKFVNEETYKLRTQDLESTFHDSGQFYWFTSSAILQKKNYVNNMGAIIVNELDVQDIDNEVDWKMAEMKYKLLNK